MTFFFSLRSRLLSYFTPCLHIDKVSIVCTAIKHVLIHSQSVIHVLRLSAGGSQTTPGRNLTELWRLSLCTFYTCICQNSCKNFSLCTTIIIWIIIQYKTLLLLTELAILFSEFFPKILLRYNQLSLVDFNAHWPLNVMFLGSAWRCALRVTWLKQHNIWYRINTLGHENVRK